MVSSEERIERVELGVWKCLRPSTFHSQEQRRELQPTPRNSISVSHVSRSLWKPTQLHKSCPNLSKVLTKKRCRFSFVVWENKRYCVHCLGVPSLLLSRNWHWARKLVRLIAVWGFWSFLEKKTIGFHSQTAITTALCISFNVLHLLSKKKKKKKRRIFSGVRYSLCLLAWCPKKSNCIISTETFWLLCSCSRPSHK